MNEVEHAEFEHFLKKLDQVMTENQISSVIKELELDPNDEEKASKLYELNVK